MGMMRVCFSTLAGVAVLGCTAGLGTALAATNAVPDMVVRFSMDEQKGGAYMDLVTSNALARAVNATTSGNGKLAGACEIAGKNSYVELEDSPKLNPKRLTVSIWFRDSKEAWATRYLLEKGSDKGYALSIVGGGAKDNPRRGKLRAVVGGKDVLSDESVNNDMWHHAALTYDGQTVRLYVDGVLQKQTAALGGDLPSNTSKLTLGMNRSATSPQDKEIAFGGLIDEVAIFSRALNEDELKRVRSMAKPKFTKWQVERRLKELKELYDRGLLLKEFYDRKVDECEVVE